MEFLGSAPLRTSFSPQRRSDVLKKKLPSAWFGSNLDLWLLLGDLDVTCFVGYCRVSEYDIYAVVYAL